MTGASSRNLTVMALALSVVGCGLVGEPTYRRMAPETALTLMDAVDDLDHGSMDVPQIDGGDSDSSVSIDTPEVQDDGELSTDVVVVLPPCPPGQQRCGEQCVNLQGNPERCGACNRVCPNPPHAAATCVNGSCQFLCDPGFDNCDGDDSNGCESSLSASGSCGSCGVQCVGAQSRCALVGGVQRCVTDCPAGQVMCGAICANLQANPSNCGQCLRGCPAGPHQFATCRGGVCGAACDAGYANCNGDPMDGCETLINGGDNANCGGCGVHCQGAANQSATCVVGVCRRSCQSGFGDCDGVAPNGCETNLNTNTNHCGSCNSVCPLVAGGNRVPACTGGMCGFVCAPGFADCNRPGLCNVELAADVNNCLRCGNVCPNPLRSACGPRGCATCLIGSYCPHVGGPMGPPGCCVLNLLTCETVLVGACNLL